MAANNGRRAVAVYLGFTLAFSSIFYFLIAKSGHVGGGWGAYIGCLMWCPGVAALLTCKYLGPDVSSLGRKWGKTRYQAIRYFILLAYGTVTYAFVWLAGLGGFTTSSSWRVFRKTLDSARCAPGRALLLHLYSDDHCDQGLRYRPRGRDRLARISCTGACQSKQFCCDRYHFRIHLGPCPEFSVCRRPQRWHAGLVLPSTVHRNAVGH